MTFISIRKANFYLRPVAQDPANSTFTKKLMRTTTSPPEKYLHHPVRETGGLSPNCKSIFWQYLSMRAQTLRFGSIKCSNTSFGCSLDQRRGRVVRARPYLLFIASPGR